MQHTTYGWCKACEFLRRMLLPCVETSKKEQDAELRREIYSLQTIHAAHSSNKQTTASERPKRYKKLPLEQTALLTSPATGHHQGSVKTYDALPPRRIRLCVVRLPRNPSRISRTRHRSRDQEEEMTWHLSRTQTDLKHGYSPTARVASNTWGSRNKLHTHYGDSSV